MTAGTCFNGETTDLTTGTSFTRLVGCTLPVQQAPMGAVAGPALAAAVAAAGGLGMISATGLSAEQIEPSLALGPGRVGVNFVTADLDLDAVAAAAATAPLVDFFWSPPSPRIVDLVHAGGALACWQVGSLAEALAAVDAGCDVVVAQGREAGGHVRGDLPLAVLLDRVLAAVDVPVLAAGGLATRSDVTRVLQRGAARVRLGTRLLATSEAAAHPDYKSAIVAAPPGSTVVTDAFSDCPLCHTSARARVLASCLPIGGDAVGLSGRPPDLTAAGEVSQLALYAGAGAGRISSIEPAGKVLADLCTWVGEPPRRRANATQHALA